MRVFGSLDDARWGRAGENARRPAVCLSFGLGRSPIRTCGNDEQASSVARAGGWRTGRDQKSPLRRCFKPRPPWRTGCAGFASGCQSSVRSSSDPKILRSARSCSGRLSGLLSGCPPIDTRPQARAKLGKAQLSHFAKACKSFALLSRLSNQKNRKSFRRRRRHYQKSPSVVALSRVPRGERGAPVSPPAAGRGSPPSLTLRRAFPNPP